MRTISSAAIAEKNKIATTSVWIILLEIILDGGETLRLAANNEDVSWNSLTWEQFIFHLDTLGEPGKGEIPSVVVKVSNVTGQIQQKLEELDGANGSTVVIRVINTAASSSTESELELTFKLSHSDFDDTELTFHLSGGNCLSRRVPARRFDRNFCGFTYGDIRCGVSAATKATYPTCNQTNANCVERSNSARFGGFKWMPKR